jgi:hypothetical protein
VVRLSRSAILSDVVPWGMTELQPMWYLSMWCLMIES